MLAGLLAGCARYHAEPLSPSASADALLSRTLEDPRLHKFIVHEMPEDEDGTAGASQWGLAKLTLAALYYHPDLAIARSQLATAEARVITAGQHPNPSLGFDELAFAPGTAAASPWIIAPIVNVLIETAGKRQYRTAEAKNLVDAARRDVATAAWGVRGRVRTAMLSLWASRQRLALTRQSLARQEQLLDLYQRRLTAGATSARTVTRERITRNRLLLDIEEAKARREQAKSALARAIAVPMRALAGIRLSFAAFDRPGSPNLEGEIGRLRRGALLGRSDLQSRLADYAAAQSALQLEIAHQYPDVTLSPGYIFDPGANAYLLLPAVDLPIFNQNQGPIAEAQARRREAAARFTALQAGIIAEIDSAYAGYQGKLRSLATADVLLAEAERRDRQVSHSFAAGEVDRPTLVAGKLELAAARLSHLDAVIGERRALGSLEDALQHPLFEPDAGFLVPDGEGRPAAPLS